MESKDIRSDGSRLRVESKSVAAPPGFTAADASFTPSGLPDSHRLPDLICLSHLRWDFVFQRPQHLLTRCAKDRRVFFFEEPLVGDGSPRLAVSGRSGGVFVAVPHLPRQMSEDAAVAAQKQLLDKLLDDHEVAEYILWYYTPMAIAFSRHLTPAAIVYDCMDELSAFAGAPPALRNHEAELFTKADVVFTGGQTLYEAKRRLHPNVHAFPSSVDVRHFAQARRPQPDPPDQAGLPHPRLGFFGVIDERMDLRLIEGVAAARPDWHLVLIGPTAKIDPDCLPKVANVHVLGPKRYQDLPRYLAGWDVALLPFARNESTRFISPTKTPEYLAAGQPVVSTSIRDVIRPYGQLGLVRVADTVLDFVAAVEAALREDPGARRLRADAFLTQTSWDGTWARMRRLMDAAVRARLPRDHRPAAALARPTAL
jgi:UDP-galactopyranose mutase